MRNLLEQVNDFAIFKHDMITLNLDYREMLTVQTH